MTFVPVFLLAASSPEGDVAERRCKESIDAKKAESLGPFGDPATKNTFHFIIESGFTGSVANFENTLQIPFVPAF